MQPYCNSICRQPHSNLPLRMTSPAARAVLTAAMLCVIGVLAGLHGIAAAKPPDSAHVLLLDSRPQVDDTLRKGLADHGLIVVTQAITAPLTDDMLRQFEVVVLAGFHGTSIESFFIVPHSILRQQLTLQRNLDVLKRYVDGGGGLLLMPAMLGSGVATARSVSEFLAPFGARLHALQVRDPDHTFEPHFAWTSDVTKHPATANVSTIFYPHNMLRWDDGYATPTFELTDPEWTTLVRGMPTSFAASGANYTQWKATDMNAPPIAAVRAAGRGRLGLLAISNFYVFRSPFAKVPRGWIGESNVGDIDGIFMEQGDGQTASDGFALLRGILDWLAESAADAGFGGYDEQSFAALPRPQMPEVPRWLQSWTPDSGAQPHHVLIGARSAFSDGTGTIEEYAQAARDAGLALLIMTETFERFEPQRWTEFVEACEQAGDATLTILPGLDITDQHGTRYLFFGKNMDFPKPNLLTADGKYIKQTQYFSLGLGAGVMVAHRVGGQLHHPHELLKHYHGMSVFTYRDGELVDDGRQAYAWQVNAYSNPLPFVTHEVRAPARLGPAAAAGHQLYVMAPNPAEVAWYLGEMAGLAHFWEMPLRMQISAGPLITEFLAANFLRLESAVPIREIRLYDHGEVIRRWKPDANTFTLPRVKLPDAHKTWTHLVAEDADGRSVVSPGILSGRGSKWGYTWRCADRQNWTHPFITLYTGQEIFHFDVRVPGAEQAGDLAAVNEFRLASWATYIQDSRIEHCYPDAEWEEYARDAKPVPRTVPIEGFRGRIRFHQFYHPDTRGWTSPHPDNMPTLKKIELELMEPLTATGDVFPQIVSPSVRSDQSREPPHVGSDRSFAYRHPETGEHITGELTEGVIDIPSGGRIGGLIALSDGLRVTARGVVGFAPPVDPEQTLPAGTRWQAAFVTVDPYRAEEYRSLMGLTEKLPFTLTFQQGALEALRYVAYCNPEDGGVRGTVTVPFTDEYYLPVALRNANPRWEAALWRSDGTYRPIPIFEAKAWARLDVGRDGEFYVGHTVMSDNPDLHLGVLHWSAQRIDIEVHNPTDAAINAEVWTAPAIPDRKALRASITVPPGSSRIVSDAGQ